MRPAVVVRRSTSITEVSKTRRQPWPSGAGRIGMTRTTVSGRVRATYKGEETRMDKDAKHPVEGFKESISARRGWAEGVSMAAVKLAELADKRDELADRRDDLQEQLARTDAELKHATDCLDDLIAQGRGMAVSS